MKTKNLKRLLSTLLCLCMVVGLLPAVAFAADGDVAINETNFPDANFRNFVSSTL